MGIANIPPCRPFDALCKLVRNAARSGVYNEWAQQNLVQVYPALAAKQNREHIYSCLCRHRRSITAIRRSCQSTSPRTTFSPRLTMSYLRRGTRRTLPAAARGPKRRRTVRLAGGGRGDLRADAGAAALQGRLDWAACARRAWACRAYVSRWRAHASLYGELEASCGEVCRLPLSLVGTTPRFWYLTFYETVCNIISYHIIFLTPLLSWALGHNSPPTLTLRPTGGEPNSGKMLFTYRYTWLTR